jgi:dTDP-4-amino-4,6-dideoxygalactose transaminase
MHQIGMPCDLPRFVPIAERYSIPPIQDAACAIGSEILWDGRWTDILASVGREQLKRTPELRGRRREIAATYPVLLADVPELRLSR